MTVTVNSDDSGQPIAIDPRPDYEFHQIHLRPSVSKEGRSPLSQLSPSSAALPVLRSDAIIEMMASTMTTAPYT